MAHTYSYSALKSTKFHKDIRIHARMINHIEIINLNADTTHDYMYPLSYTTKNDNNEVYCLHEAMQQEDRDDFILVMQKDIEDHCCQRYCQRHWQPALRSAIGDAKILKSVWSFKHKC